MQLHAIRSVDRSSAATAEKGLRERHLLRDSGKENIALEFRCVEERIGVVLDSSI